MMTKDRTPPQGGDELHAALSPDGELKAVKRWPWNGKMLTTQEVAALPTAQRLDIANGVTGFGGLSR